MRSQIVKLLAAAYVHADAEATGKITLADNALELTNDLLVSIFSVEDENIEEFLTELNEEVGVEIDILTRTLV